MVTNSKTLIIFDTNTLRSVSDDEVTYSTFKFGSAFSEIESFISENGLFDIVKIAIPRIVIEELKKQKTDRYSYDVDILSEVYSRLSEMPHINSKNIELLKSSFDCISHVDKLAQNFLSEKKIQVIELPVGEKLKDFFQRIIDRALKIQPPFKQSNKYSDSGFKDALIWESILAFDEIKNVSKVILLTADSGISNEKCKKEFENKTKKFISFQQLSSFTIEELKVDYSEYLKEHSFMVFAKSDYFKDFLVQQLSRKKYLIVKEQKFQILNFQIIGLCQNIEPDQEYNKAEDPESNWRVITSEIGISINRGGKESGLKIKARTHVDENREINNVDFDQELAES